MTDDNSTNELVDIPEDLSTFKDAFYGKEEAVVEQEDTEDNDLATDKGTDAAEADEDAAEEESETEDDTSDDKDNSDEDQDDESDEDEHEEEDKGKGRKPGYQKRINELTRARREAERREAALLQRLEAIEASTRKPDSQQESPTGKASLPQGAPVPDAVDAKGEPKYPLGEFDPQYIFDLTQFSIDVKTQEIEDRKTRELEAARIAEAQNALKADWQSKLEAFEEDVPDVREHIENLVEIFQNVTPAYGEYLATTIMTCENGPAIMEYLSQNIGEAQKIVASGPAAATLAIGRLEARLTKPARSNEEEKRNKKTSGAAPPPPKAVRGSSNSGTSVKPDTMDLAAFKREFLK